MCSLLFGIRLHTIYLSNKRLMQSLPIRMGWADSPEYMPRGAMIIKLALVGYACWNLPQAFHLLDVDAFFSTSGEVERLSQSQDLVIYDFSLPQHFAQKRQHQRKIKQTLESTLVSKYARKTPPANRISRRSTLKASRQDRLARLAGSHLPES